MPDEVEEVLPRAVALSWGVAERPQRGPKRELSIERIIDTAVGIADREGLAAVSMSRIATELGFTTMSLYRYVSSKDDVLALMQDAVCDIAIPPDEHGSAQEDQGADWRGGLRRWSMSSIEVIQAHPWFPDIPISGIPLMPNNLAVLDWGLREMRDLPLTDAEKMGTALLLASYARAVGVVERDVRQSREKGSTPPQNGEAFTAALAALVTPERFPDLAPLVASGGYADGEDEQDDFAFGLERILDGIERYIAARDSGEPVVAYEPRPEPLPRDKAVREAAKQRREAEKALREARKREREAIARARERERERR